MQRTIPPLVASAVFVAAGFVATSAAAQSASSRQVTRDTSIAARHLTVSSTNSSGRPSPRVTATRTIRKKPSAASIGEGGRDLVPRFRMSMVGSSAPFVSLELYGDAGDKPSLIGVDQAYVRANPVVTAGFMPNSDVTMYMGLGPGAAIVGASTRNTNPQAVAEQVAWTGAALVGSRWTGASFPMVFECRADTVAGQGFAATFNFAIEIAQ